MTAIESLTPILLCHSKERLVTKNTATDKETRLVYLVFLEWLDIIHIAFVLPCIVDQNV